MSPSSLFVAHLSKFHIVPSKYMRVRSPVRAYLAFPTFANFESKPLDTWCCTREVGGWAVEEERNNVQEARAVN